MFALSRINNSQLRKKGFLPHPDPLPMVSELNSSSRRPSEDILQLKANLLDALSAAVIATDIKGNITYWNRFAEELYGWSAKETVGRNIMQFVVPPETEQEAIEIMSLLRTGQTWTGEFRVKRKDGSSFTALVTDSPVLDGDGLLIG